MNDIWPIVHAERAALIDDLTGLDADHWQQQSLCEQWSVHDVLAHLVDSARTTRVGFLAGLAGARFNFDRHNERGIQRERRAGPAQTLQRFRQVASRTSTPPAHLDSRLVEEIVHGQDIRRPLGLARHYPHDAVIRALRYQARTPASFGGAKELMSQIRVAATDTDVSVGDGPVVIGPASSLLLAISGRRAALDDVDGPGTNALARLI